MREKCLIIYIPVLHRGYVDFLSSNRERIADIYILGDDLLEECSGVKPDIASLDVPTMRNLLAAIGFSNVGFLSKSNIGEIKGKALILIQDEVSRNLHEKYLKDQQVEWASVFLRWDKDSVISESVPLDIEVSKDPFDAKMLREAYGEAKKSSDWWRQVGAVAVKRGKVFARSYNQGVPSDHTPYQVGAVRDFLKPGERPELTNYIHAEQKIIAEAAKSGVGLRRSSLYVTHFPCPVCAKLVAHSGIERLYFGEGSSALDGRQVLESAGVRILRVSHDY